MPKKDDPVSKFFKWLFKNPFENMDYQKFSVGNKRKEQLIIGKWMAQEAHDDDNDIHFQRLTSGNMNVEQITEGGKTRTQLKYKGLKLLDYEK